MRCYKCNSVLSDNDYCLKCGADVSIYKVVVKVSNAYYNLGLEKAQVRDLTGAITALRTSLKINKANIKARNLLGLIYFEMGEIALALKEWVISVNLKPDKNVATVYIRKVKSNQNKLEIYNQATKKYNFALEKNKEGDDDVALIQLKKVVSMNPRFIKALLLLTLSYMKAGDNEKAAKTIAKVIKIDRNNTLALRYLDEIRQTGVAAADNKEEIYYKARKKTALSGNDVILPPNSYKEPSSGILTVLQIVLGVIIGAAMVWFLVIPAKMQTAQKDNNATIKEYSEQLSAYSVSIADLEKEVEGLSADLKAAQQELAGYNGSSGTVAMYNKLIEAASAYINEDFEGTLLLLAEMDVTQLPTDMAKDLYTRLEDNCSGGAKTYYVAGVNAYNKEDYVNAITCFKTSIRFDDSTVETPYYLAMSYLKLNDFTNAQQYIDIVNNRFKDTTYAAELRAYVESITNE